MLKKQFHFQNQEGTVPLLLILGGIGLLGFLVIANLVPFKDSFLSSIYQKVPSFAAETAGVPIQFYVSPAGSDANNGTLNLPFKTIEKAKQEVRKVNQTAKSDIYVILKKGIYTLQNSLVFNSLDSGFNGYYIRYISEGTSVRPVINGGKIISGWQEAPGNTWRAYAGSNNPIRQLYINGKRAPRAGASSGLGLFQVTNDGLIYSDDRISKFKNIQNIEVVINNAFVTYRCQIDHAEGRMLYMKKPCWDTVIKYKYLPELPQPVALENAYELIDTPGEWYWNRSDGYIYYFPKSGESISTSTFVIPALEKIIDGQASDINPVHNIVFQNLDFAYSSFNEPSQTGFIGLQGIGIFKGAVDSTGITPMPGGISIPRAEGIWFIRNGFYHMGAAGLNIGRGSKNNFILGNVFTDISGQAIFLGDNNSADVNNPSISIITSGNTIRNNYIHDVGLEFQDSNGIYVGYAKNTSIIHNSIFNIPYSGISLAYETIPSYGGYNTISQNLVHDAMMGKNLYDGGSIYVKGEQSGTIVTENVMHSQHNPNGNIYLDGPNGVRVTRNIIYNILSPDAPYRTASVGGCNNELYNNYWQRDRVNHVIVATVDVRNQPCQIVSKEYSNTNITSPTQAPQDILNGAGLEKDYQDISFFPPPEVK